jgi:hypothetical protein
MAKRFASALLPALALSAPAYAAPAPDGFFLSANTRLREEVIDGQARTGVAASDQWTSLRTQLRAEWRHGALQIVGEVWDSRLWGANTTSPISTGEVNTLEPVQAYLQANLGPILGKDTTTTVQAGRMMLNLGSRRLIAADDYRNTTNGYTGLRADLATRGGTTATAFFAMPQTRLPDVQASLLDNGRALDKESLSATLWGGLLAHQAKGSPYLAEASFIRFAERDATGRPTRDRHLNNAGLRFAADPRPAHVDGGAEAIYQWGTTSTSLAPTAAKASVSATFLRAHLGYTFAGPWKPHLLAEFDRASGDGPSGTYGRFDTLFGFRRADLGPAAQYSALSRSNLLSPGIRLEITPSKRFDAFAGYRALWLADAHDAFSGTGVRDATGKSGTFAGHQFDSRARRWLIPNHLRAEVNATYLLRGHFLQTAPGAPKSDTKYASLALSAFF